MAASILRRAASEMAGQSCRRRQRRRQAAAGVQVQHTYNNAPHTHLRHASRKHPALPPPHISTTKQMRRRCPCRDRAAARPAAAPTAIATAATAHRPYSRITPPHHTTAPRLLAALPVSLSLSLSRARTHLQLDVLERGAEGQQRRQRGRVYAGALHEGGALQAGQLPQRQDEADVCVARVYSMYVSGEGGGSGG